MSNHPAPHHIAPEPSPAPIRQFKIKDFVLSVPDKYEVGHQLNANETEALNALRVENMRNNFYAMVKEALEANTATLEGLQAKFNDYESTYSFGVRRPRGQTISERSTPLYKEAFALAVDRIRKAYAAQGKSSRKIGAEAINELAHDLLSKKETATTKAIFEMAQVQLDGKAKLGNLVLQGLDKSE